MCRKQRERRSNLLSLILQICKHCSYFNHTAFVVFTRTYIIWQIWIGLAVLPCHRPPGVLLQYGATATLLKLFSVSHFKYLRTILHFTFCLAEWSNFEYPASSLTAKNGLSNAKILPYTWRSTGMYGHWTLLHNFQLSTKAAVTLTSRIHFHYCELYILATVFTCNWMHWKQIVSTQDMNLSENGKDL